MIRFINLFFFSFAFIWLVCTKASGQQNLMDFDNSLKFARYLKASGQYDFASQEYERLHFMSPADTTVRFEMVQNYRLNKQCDKLAFSHELFKNEIFQLHSLSFAEEFIKFSITCKSGDDRIFKITSLLEPELKSFYELSYYWATGETNSVISYVDQNENLLKTTSPDLFQVSAQFSKEKHKSPVLASVFSAILPGSGKAYSKNWGDALVSLLFVSTNAWASYRAFNKKGVKSVNGWIFGGLAFSFYSSNIFGSAKAAKKFNLDLNAKYQKHAEDIIFSSF